MKIKPDDLVLEVGSGNNPNPRSDILADRYLLDNGQRAGGFRIVVDRPLVVADGYRLPFGNKTFDYVICSHILEHMEQPQEFVREIMRVGKAGYIEVPSDVSERIFGWNFHRWYCAMRGNTLTLIRKKEGERFDEFFHRLIANQIWFRRFFEEHEEKFYIKYEWKDKISLGVQEAQPSQGVLDGLDKKAWSLLVHANPHVMEDGIFYVLWMKRRAVRKIQKVARRLLWRVQCTLFKERIMLRLSRVLICPLCQSDRLTKKHNRIECTHCHTVFPMTGVIPVMLSPAERKRGY